MNCIPKILIVDDDNFSRTMLRLILRDEKAYQIDGEVHNGFEALEHIAKTKPDIVLMDIMMPEMDGLEALLKIKGKHPEIIVIMTTCNSSAKNVQQSMRDGASGIIVKPFAAATLMAALDKACGMCYE